MSKGDETRGTRAALIIATHEYDDEGLSKLDSVPMDAEELAHVLADTRIGNYQVRSQLNKPADAVREAIEEFFAEARRDDALLLYLSGHGVKDQDGRLCFAASTTKLRRLASTGIPAEFVHQQVERCRARHIILLLDCCYSGAYPAGRRPRSGGRVSLGRLAAGRPPGEGWAVITSCTDIEYSFEIGPDEINALAMRKAEPSVFTAAVVRGLHTGAADRDGDGLVSVDDLYDYVWEQVRDSTPHQSPVKMGTSRGNLVIATSPAGIVQPVPQRRADLRGRRRRAGILAVSAAIVLGALGAGLAYLLNSGHSPTRASSLFTVNTCSHGTAGPAPAKIGSITTGRASNDYVGVAFSPDCHLLATEGEGTVQVWNAVTGKRITTMAAAPGTTSVELAYTTDGKILAATSARGPTTLWNPTTGQHIATLNSDPYGTWCVAFTPDGRELFTGGDSGTIDVWNVRTHHQTGAIPTGSEVGYMALSPDGKVLAVGGNDGNDRLYDAVSRKLTRTLPGGGGHVFIVAFSPDSTTLAAGTDNGGVQWWDVPTGKLIASGDARESVTALAFSPGGGILAVGSYGVVQLWNARTHQLITTLAIGNGDYPQNMAFNRTGRILAVGWRGTLQFWNVAGITASPG